jgi:hypothetical protein
LRRPPPARISASYRLNPIAEREIGETDYALRHLDWAVTAACAHRGDAGDELDLTDWAHLDRPAGTIHRAAFLEDGGDYVVAAIEISEQFRQQIGPAAAVP